MFLVSCLFIKKKKIIYQFTLNILKKAKICTLLQKSVFCFNPLSAHDEYIRQGQTLSQCA